MPRPQDRSHWFDVTSKCEAHGLHQGIICPKCHAVNTIRIEKESVELRAERTPEFMRAQRAKLLSESNGQY